MKRFVFLVLVIGGSNAFATPEVTPDRPSAACARELGASVRDRVDIFGPSLGAYLDKNPFLWTMLDNVSRGVEHARPTAVDAIYAHFGTWAEYGDLIPLAAAVGPGPHPDPQAVFERLKDPSEKWSDRVFEFYRAQSRATEAWAPAETVIRMLAHSRRNFRISRAPTVPESKLLKYLNTSFAAAFSAEFGIDAPVDLRVVTRVTDDFSSGDTADRVGGRTFISGRSFGGTELDAFVVHEALHLCFPGFKNTTLEEAFLEYVRARLWKAMALDDFDNTSETYGEWQKQLERLFRMDPDLEAEMIGYFIRAEGPTHTDAITARIAEWAERDSKFSILLK